MLASAGKQEGEAMAASPCGYARSQLCRAVSMVTVVDVMVATMVGSGKCRSSSRCEHHNEKGEGDLPHASFISR
jgi:hypothetical protein